MALHEAGELDELKRPLRLTHMLAKVDRAVEKTSAAPPPSAAVLKTGGTSVAEDVVATRNSTKNIVYPPADDDGRHDDSSSVSVSEGARIAEDRRRRESRLRQAASEVSSASEWREEGSADQHLKPLRVLEKASLRPQVAAILKEQVGCVSPPQLSGTHAPTPTQPLCVAWVVWGRGGVVLPTSSSNILCPQGTPVPYGRKRHETCSWTRKRHKTCSWFPQDAQRYRLRYQGPRTTTAVAAVEEMDCSDTAGPPYRAGRGGLLEQGGRRGAGGLPAGARGGARARARRPASDKLQQFLKTRQLRRVEADLQKSATHIAEIRRDSGFVDADRVARLLEDPSLSDFSVASSLGPDGWHQGHHVRGGGGGGGGGLRGATEGEDG